MLQTSQDKSYIQCGNKRIFKSHAGFVYACENGFLNIIQFIKDQNNFRIYHEGDHIHIDIVASLFKVSYKEIVQWRNHVWKRVYSENHKRSNVYKPQACKQPNQLNIDLQVTLPSTIRELEVRGCFVDEHKEPWKGFFKQFITDIENPMSQIQRLQRIQQKQREYCTDLGMPESLIERNIAFAVTKFYEEEDKHQETLKKQLSIINHDMEILKSAHSADYESWKAQNTLVHSLQSRLDSARSVCTKLAKTKRQLESTYNIRKTEREELIKQIR